MATTKLSGLARMLVKEQQLSEADAGALQLQSDAARVPFITQVIASKKLSAAQIAATGSKSFGFPYFNLDTLNPDYLPAKPIDLKLMQSHRVMALQSRNGILFVGVSDPTMLHALDSVRFQMGMKLSPVIVEDDKLEKWINKNAEANDTSLSSSLDIDDDFDLLMGTEDEP